MLTIETKKGKEVVDITENINSFLKEKDFKEGICCINVLHTTAALSTADLDPGTDLDMIDAFYEMIPKLNYRHPHDPEHVPDHILSAIIGSSLVLPVKNGKVILGTWQRAVLFEFDGPRKRSVAVTLK